jgi:UDP-GlcNAc:undecaprenyl-phosphate GlcNAc-1-phosphate transferase
MTPLVLFFTGLVVSFLLTPLVRELALSWGIVDHPNRRKIHAQPIARMGGVAVYLAWVLALAIGLEKRDIASMGLFVMLMSVGLVMVLFGVWDDWVDLRGRVKLACQVAIGTLVFLLGARIDVLSNPLGGQLVFPLWLSYLFTVCWVVGMMNALNLIDGMDGLAAGIAAIAALFLVVTGCYLHAGAAVGVLAALAGACLGFLRYNFHPASIFLGDSGSQFIGFVFAMAALVDKQYKTATAMALLMPLTALSLPIVDTALAIIRRWRGNRSLFRADRFHIHHRLLRMGLSQRQVVLFLYLATAYLGLFAFMFVLIQDRWALLLLALLGLGLVMALQVLRFIEWTIRRHVRQMNRPRR